jgi:hypothetical protein
VVTLIRRLQEEFECTEKQTYFLGTSKGATTAIAYAFMTAGENVLRGEPQNLLGDFIYQDRWQELEQFRSLAHTMMGRVDLCDRPLLNRVVLDIAQRYGPSFKGEITIHVGDTFYLEKHVSHLSRISKELCFDSKIHIKSHEFTKHEEVIPVFLDTVAHTINTDVPS